MDSAWFSSLDPDPLGPQHWSIQWIQKRMCIGTAPGRQTRTCKILRYHGDLFRSNSLNLQLERMCNTLECPKQFWLDYKLYFLSDYAGHFLTLSETATIAIFWPTNHAFVLNWINFRYWVPRFFVNKRHEAKLFAATKTIYSVVYFDDP